MAIGYFESGFSFDDYIEDRNQKESKEKGSKSAGSKDATKDKANRNSGDEGSNSEDEEEEEEEIVANWDRMEAEQLYTSTRGTL